MGSLLLFCSDREGNQTMSEHSVKQRLMKKVEWIGVLLGVAYWIVESMMDTYVYDLGPLVERLFHPDPNEIEMRSLAVSTVVAFGFYAQFMIKRLERTEDRLTRMNKCFLSFGPEPMENIDRLTALCGELLGGTVALYNRLDRGLLCSWGQWNMPPDRCPPVRPEGHVCFDVIKGGKDDVVVVRNLQETSYAAADPKIIPRGMSTYIGKAVRLGQADVGSLCVLYQDDYVLGEEDRKLMGILASAIGVEEVRRQAEEALRESGRQLRHLSSQLLSAQEAERKRIARQLHDSIGQSLSAIKFSIEETIEVLGDGTIPREKLESLEASVSLIREVSEEVRRMHRHLRPSMLDDLGIIATISWFCREFQTIYSHISVEKEIVAAEDEIPEPLKTVIYRILQEAMNNVAKHSGANLVNVYLATTEGVLELVIEDNGRGFDLNATPSTGSPGGLGLSSMRERAELSGGSFHLESAMEEGARIRALWPLEETESK